MDANVVGAERESEAGEQATPLTKSGGLWRLRDAAITHLFVGAIVCFFILAPALFTPRAFGYDYTNHIWLVWQQGLAISNTGHPTLFLQLPGGIFEPFYGFYGGTLYATAGAVSALSGNHAYPTYVASIGAATAIAYGGMWWLGRQLGLSRWVAHLPAFVVVTGAYYLTDAYMRGAWPEFVALSAVPMFIAGATRLLTGPWRAGPIALFVLGTVAMTGSHNLTLFWSVLVIGPVAVAVWIAAGRARPSIRRVVSVAALAVAAVGINAWFLVLDMSHANDVQAWPWNEDFVGGGAFAQYFYFNNLGVVLDPLRGTPSQSTTYGLAIAPPMAAFALGVVLLALSWPQLRRGGWVLKAVWLILLAAMVLLVGLMVMPASWWVRLGPPLTNIQFPYRLAGWLLIAVGAQLAVSLRLARGLSGSRRYWAIGLASALVVVTVVQASAQLYAGPRLDGEVNSGLHPRQAAFAHGPTTPPDSFYDPNSYADASLPVVETPPNRVLMLPVPEPGQTRFVADVKLPPGSGPIATNIAAGPYVVRVEGMKVVGRTVGGSLVVKPPPGKRRTARLVVVADGGTPQLLAGAISILCLVACLSLVAGMAEPRLRISSRLAMRGRR